MPSAKAAEQAIVEAAYDEFGGLFIPRNGHEPVPLKRLFGRKRDQRSRDRKEVAEALEAHHERLKEGDMLECEPRFFVPLKALLPELHKPGVVRLLVTQAYFLRRNISRLCHALPELAEHEELLTTIPVNQIRVRCTHDPKGATEFELSVKCKIDPNKPEVKIDIPVKLTADTFLVLAAFSDGGAMQKLRYAIPGHLLVPQEKGDAKKKVPMVAEADVILRTGMPLERVRRRFVRFALVEPDVKDVSLLSALRNGQHTFPFLLPEMDLHLRGDALRRLFRMKTLARYGFSDEADQAVGELSKQYFKLREAAAEKEAAAGRDGRLIKRARKHAT